VEQDTQYDRANRLISLTAQNTANHALLNNSYQYGYGPLGLTSGITTTVQGSPSSQSLTHDAAGRLTAVSGAAPTGGWSYDGRGNVTSATSNGTTKSYSYASGNPEEVTSTSIAGQPTTYYAYDGNGDTTAITNTSTLNRQLGYDTQARLVQVTMGSPVTQTVAIAYNAFGQRASYSVTPTGAGQPSLAESFKYQGGQLAQVAYTGTGITTPYTDTYVYMHGVNGMCRQVGFAVGIAFLGAMLTNHYNQLISDRIARDLPQLPANAKAAMISSVQHAGTIPGSLGLPARPGIPNPFAHSPAWPAVQQIARASFVDGTVFILWIAAAILAVGTAAAVALIRQADMVHIQEAAESDARVERATA
jgi:YD repeat-containing protein